MAGYGFVIEQQGPEGARRGRLITAHGEVATPAFMPCASRGVVRACSPDDLAGVGVQMMVCNTHHLRLRPGAEVVASLGGLHAFISWRGPLVTDSGGFQGFSLAGGQAVEEDGIKLRSPVDGSLVFLSPEEAMRAQTALGADVIVALDICAPYPVSHQQAHQATELTLRWARRCLAAWERDDQWLWGVVQGSVYPDLRARSARETAALGFTGFGIGGLSVGERRAERLAALEVAVAHLPAEAPKWVMGVGTPRDIVECVLRGADLFDCVLPTRMARHGSVYTAAGPLKIGQAEYRRDERPLEENCDCPACRLYSRAYLHYLFRLEEAAGWRLLSLHNLRFYARLMESLRAAVARGTVRELLASLPPWTQRDQQGVAPAG
jgi:queuine tRNA-ribosyltransferase